VSRRHATRAVEGNRTAVTPSIPTGHGGGHALLDLQQAIGNRGVGQLYNLQRSEESAAGNDPEQLSQSDPSELFRLYLSTDEVVTLAPSDATYSHAWTHSARGSAQVRDAVRDKLAAIAAGNPPGSWPTATARFLQQIEQLGGDAERQAHLRDAVAATFATDARRLENELLEAGDRRLTAQGYLARLPAPPARTNHTDRPLFIRSGTDMVAFEGAHIHPAVRVALRSLLDGLRAEGARLNDESARQARVASGWRAPTAGEGAAYLRALHKTIRQGLDHRGRPYEYPAFPSALEETARSELGASGSQQHREFQRQLAASPGWTAASAAMLLRVTGAFKAPRGGSTHHSGVVVDIDWPCRTGAGIAVTNHGMNRERNAAALRTVAGRWLYEHAPALGFDTYSTQREIWHMEWRDWRGTEADPDQASP
jgi:hypothetical protein